MKSYLLSLNEPLPAYYEKLYSELKQAGQPAGKSLSVYDKEVLMQPTRWYEALALCEYALDNGENTPETEDFFEWIFKGFDCNASVDLNDDEYAWFWNKIQEIIDKQALVSPEAFVEKALQYYTARRGYLNKKETLRYLSEAVERGSETARTILGYYYYLGFCDVTDKERGMALMDTALTERGKARVAIYKGYIAIGENRKEEAEQILTSLEPLMTDAFIARLVNEQRAFLLEMSEQYDESAALYQKVLDFIPSGFAMMRLGYMNYNRKMTESDQNVGMQWMEQSFRYGRTDVARSLFYCYYEAGDDCQDEALAVKWLQKGFQYEEGYCTYQLAYLYLYNDTYKDIEKALYYLDCALSLSYVDAYICKAYLYREGEVLEKSLSACVDLLLQALALGSADAAYRLGCMYDAGELSLNGEADYANALTYFEKAAEMGEASACEYAGRYWLSGLAGEVDAEKAKAWYEKGRTMNSAYCIVELALMYEEGNGVEQDSPKSFALAAEAAELEYAHGQFLLGRCYRYAIGTDENPDEAVAAFQKAAAQNHSKALTELALCYENGYGMEADECKALEYMKQAAERDYPYAQYKTGCYYMYGLEGVPVNYPEAVAWHTQAIENDYPYSMLELGDYYLYDYEQKDEQAKAYPLYERAARQGCVNEGLGICLEYGYGVETNEGESFKYYLKAAEDGYVRAMHYTGLCYYFGTGVKENNSEAFRWFNEAAGNGNIGATYYKAKMLIGGEGCSQDLPEGITLLQQAAEGDERNAQFDLGNCYLVGKGVDENEDLAMEWFEKAADNGHEQALKLTGRRRRR